MLIYRIESLADGNGPFQSVSCQVPCFANRQGDWFTMSKMPNMESWFVLGWVKFSTDFHRAGFSSWEALKGHKDWAFKYLRLAGFIVRVYDADPDHVLTHEDGQAIFEIDYATPVRMVPLP